MKLSIKKEPRLRTACSCMSCEFFQIVNFKSYCKQYKFTPEESQSYLCNDHRLKERYIEPQGYFIRKVRLFHRLGDESYIMFSTDGGLMKISNAIYESLQEDFELKEIYHGKDHYYHWTFSNKKITKQGNND